MNTNHANHTSLPVGLVITALSAALAVAVVVAPARGATPAQVDAAIEKGQKFLLAQLQAKGNCEIVPARDPNNNGFSQCFNWQWGGPTAVSLYALLGSGVSPQDPRLAPALEWLAKADIRGFYAGGFRPLVWTFLPAAKARLNSRADVKFLSSGIIDTGPGRGFYTYHLPAPGSALPAGHFDRSVSQIAALGMWACEQNGQEISDRYWRSVENAWRESQNADGSWSYMNGRPGTPSMTAAGIATIYLTQDQLLRHRDWSRCKGGVTDESIRRGIAWMDAHVGEILTGKDPHRAYYSLYGLERIGLAGGRKYFGNVDWYQVGANWVVATQAADGAWGAESIYNPGRVADTSFALLFLARGRAPVVMNKLEYGSDDPKAKPFPMPWNERPREVANFTHWSAQITERHLNWQVVNLRGNPADLLDAPILYLSGSSHPLTFTDPEIDKLRSFVHQGGLILGNANCDSKEFTKSFKELGNKLFPQYEFRDLPEKHSIYTDQQYRASAWKGAPRLQGVSNGPRELMLLFPEGDPAKVWTNRSNTKSAAYELMQNIFLYAIDKSNLRVRGETYVVAPDPKVTPSRSVEMVRLMTGPNPDPEPGGWGRLITVVRNAGVSVQFGKVPLGKGLIPPGAKLAHLTGTVAFKLSAEEQSELKAFVGRGGTLVVDAAGGSAAFASAAEAELAAIFGGKAEDLGVVLPVNHPLYARPGAPIGTFGYRQATRKTVGKLNVPQVRGIDVGGRTGVFYSRYDLSAGLVGQEVDGIIGYDPATATAIMRNLVLYATD